MNFAWKAASWLLLGSVAAGCSVDRSVAKEIRRELPRVLGPAEDYVVQVRGTRLSDNSVREVAVIATGLRPRPDFRVAKLEANAWSIRVDPKSRAILELGRLQAKVQIDSRDVDRFVTGKTFLGRVQLAEPRVTFPGFNRAEIAAVATFTGLEAYGVNLSPRVPILARGILIATGPRLRLEVTSIVAAGITLPPVTHEWVETAINPLADLSGLPVPVRFGSFRGAQDSITAEVIG